MIKSYPYSSFSNSVSKPFEFQMKLIFHLNQFSCYCFEFYLIDLLLGRHNIQEEINVIGVIRLLRDIIVKCMGDAFVVSFFLVVLLYCVSSFKCYFYPLPCVFNFHYRFTITIYLYIYYLFRTQNKIRHLKRWETLSVQQYEIPYVNRQPVIVSTDLKESGQAILTSICLRESGQPIMTSTSWRELGRWRT